MSKPRNLTMDPLVVGMEGAAFLLNTSEDKVRELLRAGFIREVPHLTSPARRAIAITELQRFVAVGGDRGPQGGCVVSAIETTGTELTPAMLDLFEHEKVIEQGLAGFVEVGLALLAIRDGKKYRHAGYATFEDYCQRRWSISRAYGHRLIGAAETVTEMSPIGDIPAPAREAQVRPLRAVDPAERAEVWAEAVESADGGQPTAKQVEAVITTAPRARDGRRR